MDLNSLKAEQANIESAFNNKKGILAEAEAEVNRLQGEWRLVTRLIRSIEQKLEPQADAPATEVPATPVHVPVEAVPSDAPAEASANE